METEEVQEQQQPADKSNGLDTQPSKKILFFTKMNLTLFYICFRWQNSTKTARSWKKQM